MIKDKINSLSLIFKNNNGDNKKKIENLIVFVVVLVITIVVINIILKDNKKEGIIDDNIQNDVLLAKESVSNNSFTKDEFEERLENILSKINGVGIAKVMITYSQTSQTVAMYNEDLSTVDTEENASRKWYKKNK